MIFYWKMLNIHGPLEKIMSNSVPSRLHHELRRVGWILSGLARNLALTPERCLAIASFFIYIYIYICETIAKTMESLCAWRLFWESMSLAYLMGFHCFGARDGNFVSLVFITTSYHFCVPQLCITFAYRTHDASRTTRHA